MMQLENNHNILSQKYSPENEKYRHIYASDCSVGFMPPKDVQEEIKFEIAGVQNDTFSSYEQILGTLVMTDLRFLFLPTGHDDDLSFLKRNLVQIYLGSIQSLRLDKTANGTERLIIQQKDFNQAIFIDSRKRESSESSCQEQHFPDLRDYFHQEMLHQIDECCQRKLYSSLSKICPTPDINAYESVLLKDFQELGLESHPRWDINREKNERYSFSITYPSVLVLPKEASEDLLNMAISQRSKQRIPTLVWIDKDTQAPLCRSSQPLSGLTGYQNNMMVDDIDLLKCIRNTLPDGRTKKLKIFDARPYVNASANSLAGKGFEHIQSLCSEDDDTETASIEFLKIENIHVMRKSIATAVEAGLDRDGDFDAKLGRSGWNKHLFTVLKGGKLIAEELRSGSAVLIHCSDGWDRTSQLCALAQLLLDPKYRTVQGFQVLIKKEWFCMGHKFKDRLGFLGEDKESSPVFLQFLDLVFQLTCQFPQEFEFSEDYLLMLVDAIYSGCFLECHTNCDKERRDAQLNSRVKIFDYIDYLLSLSQGSNRFKNPLFEPNVHAPFLEPICEPQFFKDWQQQYMKHSSAAKRMQHIATMQKSMATELLAQTIELQAITIGNKNDGCPEEEHPSEDTKENNEIGMRENATVENYFQVETPLKDSGFVNQLEAPSQPGDEYPEQPHFHGNTSPSIIKNPEIHSMDQDNRRPSTHLDLKMSLLNPEAVSLQHSFRKYLIGKQATDYIKELMSTYFDPDPVPGALKRTLADLDEVDAEELVAVLLPPQERSELPYKIGMAELLLVARCICLDESFHPPIPSVEKLIKAACSFSVEKDDENHSMIVAPDLKGLETAVKLLASSPKDEKEGYFVLELSRALSMSQGLNSRVKSVFSFPAISPELCSTIGGPSKGGTALQFPHIKWQQFGYIFTAWIQISPGAPDFVLFKFQGDNGLTVEAKIHEEIKSGVRQFEMMTKDSELAEAHLLKDTVEFKLEFKPGEWHFITVLHDAPSYFPSTVTVTIDGQTRISRKPLHYPLPRKNNMDLENCSAFSGFQGQVSGIALYGDPKSLTDNELRVIYSAGPNFITLLQPVRVPVSTKETHTHPLGTIIGEATYKSNHPLPMLAYHALYSSLSSPSSCHPFLVWGKSEQGYLVIEPELEQSSVEACLALKGVEIKRPGLMAELWFRLGGVRCLLYVLACIVSGTYGPDFGQVIKAVLITLARLLQSDPVVLEDMLQLHGFHVLMKLLLDIPPKKLTTAIAEGVLEVLGTVMGNNSIQGIDLQVQHAALQGLGNFKLWANASPLVQAEFLEKFEGVVRPHTKELRKNVGLVGLLDWIHRHITSRYNTQYFKTQIEVHLSMEALYLLLTHMVIAGFQTSPSAVKTIPALKETRPLSFKPELPQSDVHWLVWYLHDKASDKVLASLILRVLLGLRTPSNADRFSQALFETEFLEIAACTILSGDDPLLRLKCLRLCLWQLAQLSEKNGGHGQRHQSTPIEHNIFMGLRNDLHIRLAWSIGILQKEVHFLKPEEQLRIEWACDDISFKDPFQIINIKPDAPKVLKDLFQKEDKVLEVNGSIPKSLDDLQILLDQTKPHEMLKFLLIRKHVDYWGPEEGKEAFKIAQETLDSICKPTEHCPLWLRLPFIHILVKRAPFELRLQAIDSVVRELVQSDPAVQVQLVKHSPENLSPNWITCFLEMAVCCWPVNATTEDNYFRIRQEHGNESPHTITRCSKTSSEESCIDAIARVMTNTVDKSHSTIKQLIFALNRTKATNEVPRKKLLFRVISKVLQNFTNLETWTQLQFHFVSRVIWLIEVDIASLEDLDWKLADTILELSSQFLKKIETFQTVQAVNTKWCSEAKRRDCHLKAFEASLLTASSKPFSPSGPSTSPCSTPVEYESFFCENTQQLTEAVLMVSQPITRVLTSILWRADEDKIDKVMERLLELVSGIINSQKLEIEAEKTREMALIVFECLAEQAQKRKADMKQKFQKWAQALSNKLMPTEEPLVDRSDEMTSNVPELVKLCHRVHQDGGLESLYEQLQEKGDDRLEGFVNMDLHQLDSSTGMGPSGKESFKEWEEGAMYEYSRSAHKRGEQISLQESSRADLSRMAEDASLCRVERHWRKLVRLTESELGISTSRTTHSLLGCPQYKLAQSNHEEFICPRQIIKVQAGTRKELVPNHRSEEAPQKEPELDSSDAEIQDLRESLIKQNVELAKRYSELVETNNSCQDSTDGDQSRSMLSDDVTDTEDNDENGEEKKIEVEPIYHLDLSDDGKINAQDLGPGLGPMVDVKTHGMKCLDNATLVLPKGNQFGTVYLTNDHIYFKPKSPEEDNLTNVENGLIDVVGTGALEKQKNRRWLIERINGLYERTFNHRDTAIEVFFGSGKSRSVFFDFGPRESSKRCRNKFMAMLRKKANIWVEPQIALQTATERWKQRDMSNFDYLMALNTLAGRSFNNISQYPIFPWVISEYEADQLDLRSSKHYRDLSKPMGAMNHDRVEATLECYNLLKESSDKETAFMWGVHYSTPVGTVLHYLVRLQPFASLHCAIHSGAFDLANRVFSSVPRAWQQCRDGSSANELTPEWYSLPDFLRNVNNFDFGTTQDGSKIEDVDLPPWAKTPEEFIAIQREALESDYVSENLHHWIDLIFGYKQQGQAAEEALNIFYYTCYPGNINTSKLKGKDQQMTELQIAQFGQCPKQLFTSGHPCRNSVPRPIHNLSSEDAEDLTVANGTPSLSAPICAVKVIDGKVLCVDATGRLHIFNWFWRLHLSDNDKDLQIIEDVSTQDEQPGVPLFHVEFDSCNLLYKNTIKQASHTPHFPVCLSIREHYIYVLSGRTDVASGAVTLSQLDIKTHQVLGSLTLQAHMLQVSCVAMSFGKANGAGIALLGSVDGTASLWELQNLQFGKPRVHTRPVKILRGHTSTVCCCSLSTRLGICVTCSKELALVYLLEGESLLQRIEVDTSSKFTYSYCGISAMGFIILCSQLPDTLIGSNVQMTGEGHKSQIEVYTVNGNRMPKVNTFRERIHSIQVSEDGKYLISAWSNNVIEVRSLPLLQLASKFDFSKAYEAEITSITALDLGPNPHTPYALAAGTAAGNLLVQPFAGSKEWQDSQLSVRVDSTKKKGWKTVKSVGKRIYKLGKGFSNL